jgi:hypothetical protein
LIWRREGQAQQDNGSGVAQGGDVSDEVACIRFRGQVGVLGVQVFNNGIASEVNDLNG